MYKKTFISFFAFSIITGSVASAQAADFKVSNLEYDVINFDDSTVKIVGGTPDPNLSIPSIVTYKNRDFKVVEIADYAFKNSTIQSLIIGDNITKIGEGAFQSNHNLISIEFGKALKRIEKYAFVNCGKVSYLEFNEGLEFIGIYAFNVDYSYLTAHYEYPNGLEIHIPSTIKEIGQYAFGRGGDINFLRSINHRVHIRDISSWLNVKQGHDTFQEADIYMYFGPNNEEIANIPEGTDVIKSYTFYKVKNLKAVNIPNTVTEIAVDAFAYSSIETLSIPPSVIKLSSLHLPNLHTLIFEDGNEPLFLSNILLRTNDGTISDFSAGCPIQEIYLG